MVLIEYEISTADIRGDDAHRSYRIRVSTVTIVNATSWHFRRIGRLIMSEVHTTSMYTVRNFEKRLVAAKQAYEYYLIIIVLQHSCRYCNINDTESLGTC